jgi:hypothetical protein
VIISIGNQKQKSKVHQGGGKNPQWTDTFQFQAMGNQFMKLELYDRDILKDDFIGQGSFNLTQLYKYPSKTENRIYFFE